MDVARRSLRASPSTTHKIRQCPRRARRRQPPARLTRTLGQRPLSAGRPVPGAVELRTASRACMHFVAPSQSVGAGLGASGLGQAASMSGGSSGCGFNSHILLRPDGAGGGSSGHSASTLGQAILPVGSGVVVAQHSAGCCDRRVSILSAPELGPCTFSPSAPPTS